MKVSQVIDCFLIIIKQIPKKQIVSFAELMLRKELFTYAIYNKLTNSSLGVVIAKSLSEILTEENKHIDFWIKFLEKRNVKPKLVRRNYKVLLFLFW